MSTNVGPHVFERKAGSSSECARCYLSREDHHGRMGWTEARPLEPATMKRWPIYLAGILIVVIAALVLAARGEGHLVRTPDHPKRSALENRLKDQTENLYHSRYVCRHGARANQRWHCQAATGWLLREWRETKEALRPKTPWWISRQIMVAEILGKDGDAQGTDPWPNCPDPYDHQGHSWIDTLACENRAYYERYGNTPRAWLDSPGQFRCGLQFEPRWEDKYGRLCP